MWTRVALAVSLVLAVPARAQEPPPGDGRLAVNPGVAEEASEVIADYAGDAGKSALMWAVSGIALAAYSIVAFSGGRGSDSALKYFSAVGAVGAGIGTFTSMRRGGELRALHQAINDDRAQTSDRMMLSREVVRDTGAELRRMHSALITSATSSLRAGCVTPVLLAGIAVYGFASGGERGPDLAGVSLAGAVGIGGPSMLYYLNIKRELKRMDGLMKRWNDNFPAEVINGGKKEGNTQWER